MQELSLIRPGGLCENEVCLIAYQLYHGDNGSD